MSSRIAEASMNPPVEIVILDAGSTDGLQEYMYNLMLDKYPCNIIYKRIERPCWHTAKAHNMGMLMGRGEYVVDLMADANIYSGYIQCIRSLIADGCIWGRASHFCGNKWVLKQEFIDAGGYDERMELYGPDDRDLDHRLTSRGGKFGLIPDNLINEIYTPDDKKVQNYRLPGNKHSFSKMMRPYFEENKVNKVLVANAGKKWGNWNE